MTDVQIAIELAAGGVFALILLGAIALIGFLSFLHELVKRR